MNALVLVIGALCVFALAYRYYGAFLAAKVAVLDANRTTPAHELRDGRDYHPTNRWVLFGHHFAAISGAGPLIGPVLAAQFGYLPSTLWILIGAVAAGAVHDFIILFASVRLKGLSLSHIARHHISPIAGIATAFAILFIIITALAGLGIAVVNALKESAWGTFTIAATIPAALVVALFLYKLRPGKVATASSVGVVLVILAVVLGGEISQTPGIARFFILKDTQLAIALPLYGFIASVLPVWLLLCPRDYLSSYMKIGTIVLLAIGIFAVHPVLKFPAVTPFISGGGPVFPGPLWPYICIIIMCGAISGFHALIGSGTTPKMLSNERDILPIGYGAMLVEGFVALMALIAATSMNMDVYFAINIDAKAIPTEMAFAKLREAGPMFANMHIPGTELTQLAHQVGEETLVGRTGGAVSLAVGMAQIFTGIPGFKGLLAYWYHFAIMFEALFILTTIDTGTRVARFILQELGGLLMGRKPDEMKARSKRTAIFWTVITSALICFCWGFMVYRGSVKTIWPMFGVANQLLAAIALGIGTSVILRSGKKKYALTTFLPLLFILATTFTAGVMNIQSYMGKMALKDPVTAYMNTSLTVIMLLLAAVITVEAFRHWAREIRGGGVKTSEIEVAEETAV